MWSWLQDNTAIISMLTSIATAFICLFHLQIIVSNNSRQRRALISINRGAGKNLDAHLVLCNLGYETVYVNDVIAELDVDDSSYAANITDCEDAPLEDQAGPLDGTLQGPAMEIAGPWARSERCWSGSRPKTISAPLDAAKKLSVIVLAGRETSIGVHRHYRLIHEGGQTYLDADTMNTKRISRRNGGQYRKTWGYDVSRGYSDEPPPLYSVSDSSPAA